MMRGPLTQFLSRPQSFLIYKIGVWPAVGGFWGCVNSRPGPCLRSPQGPPGGAALNRSSPGGCFPTVLEYSEPRRLPSAQESRVCVRMGGCPRSSQGAEAVTQARGPQFSRGRARPRELAQRGVHFTRAPLKIVPALRAGRNSGPR